MTWLKSTFGNESTSKTDDKKRTFRGVVAAMRVIYGFKGKNDTRQSGMFFTKHIGDLVVTNFADSRMAVYHSYRRTNEHWKITSIRP